MSADSDPRIDCTYNIADKRRRRKPSEAPLPSPSPGPVLSTRSDSGSSRVRYSSEMLPNPPPFASGSRAAAAVAATANNESDSPSAAQDDATLMMLARAMDHEQLSPDAPHHAASTPAACKAYVSRISRFFGWASNSLTACLVRNDSYATELRRPASYTFEGHVRSAIVPSQRPQRRRRRASVRHRSRLAVPAHSAGGGTLCQLLLCSGA